MQFLYQCERPAPEEALRQEVQERDPDWRKAILLTGVAVAVGSLIGSLAMNSAGPPDPTFSVAALNQFQEWEHLRGLFGVTAWVGMGLSLLGLVLARAQRGRGQ